MIDIEAVLVTWLEGAIEGVTASTKTPDDLDDNLPWLQIVRTGGSYDGYRRDQPSVDIAVFAATSTEASPLAGQVQDLLHEQFANSVVAGAVISRVETSTGPHWTPYDNPALSRYEAAYRFVVHPA